MTMMADDLHPNETIRILCEEFPKTFFENPRLRQPIKKSIVADIEARQLPSLHEADIERAIGYYTSHYGYWKTLSMAGSRRLDLDGKPAGTVTEAEARAAIENINQYNAMKAARGYPNPHDQPVRDTGSIMKTKVNGITTAKPAAPPQTDDQLIGAAMKKLTRAQVIIMGDDSDGLVGLTARPLLQSAIDDITSLVARLG